MAANRQTDRQTYIHTHARAQCSYTSVGLAQPRPNSYMYMYIHVTACIISISPIQATFHRIFSATEEKDKYTVLNKYFPLENCEFLRDVSLTLHETKFKGCCPQLFC